MDGLESHWVWPRKILHLPQASGQTGLPGLRPHALLWDQRRYAAFWLYLCCAQVSQEKENKLLRSRGYILLTLAGGLFSDIGSHIIDLMTYGLYRDHPTVTYDISNIFPNQIMILILDRTVKLKVESSILTAGMTKKILHLSMPLLRKWKLGKRAPRLVSN